MNTMELIIILALLGFLALAALVLTPVYLFLKREEKASTQWTDEELAARQRKAPPATNGNTSHDPRPR